MKSPAARIAAVLLLCLSAQACKEDLSSPEYWTKALLAPKTRDNTFKEIRKDRQPQMIDALIASSKEESSIRADVIQTLGQMGEKFPEHKDKIGAAIKEAVDYGVGGGSDKATRSKNLVNQNAATAVGRMGWEPGVEIAARLLDSKDNSTRLAAVTALGRLKAKGNIDKLIEIVNEDENNFMVKNAVIALGDIADPKAVPSLIRAMFFERGVSFYREASYALFQVGKDAVPALMEVLAGKSDALKNLPAKPDPWIIKIKCIEVLSDIGEPKTSEIVMSVLNSIKGGNPAAEVEAPLQVIAIQKAASAAGRLGLKPAIPKLKQLSTNIDFTQAELPLEALELIGDRAAGAELIKLAGKDVYMAECKAKYDEESCKNSEEEVRQLRLEAGTRLAGPAELAAVEKMEAAEKDAKLKELIGKEKSRLVAAKECGEKAECWVGKLKDPNPKVRDKAGYELSYLKNPETAAPLLAALKEDDLEARSAIFVALLRILPKTGADDVKKIVDDEQGKMQFIKINEDLKRLEVKIRRGY